MRDQTGAELFEAYKSLLDGTRREILDAMPKGESLRWRLVSLILPIVLTSGLGLTVYMVQARFQVQIDKKVEAESNALQARLALTQDYYRERLQTYKRVHEQVVALRDKTRTAAGEASFDAGFDEPTGDLYNSYSKSSIFISDDLLRDLDDLWGKAVAVTRSKTVGSDELVAVASAANATETRMRDDLHVNELDARPTAPLEMTPYAVPR